ncbi:MAG TPA: hypothetical protein PK402_04620, partial [Tepidisphaeraceae bacterium]|nr:hypothetical protein [Tepidisphaeraceae bacterium]
MDQRQILTPRMIQSMEILQLPLLALDERVDQEIQANPTLEYKQTSDEPRERSLAEPGSDNARLSVDADSATGAEFERLEKLGDYLENEEWSSNNGSSYRVRESGDGDKKLEALNNSAARAGSLAEHLREQWHLGDEYAPDVAKAGDALIDYIEADGYLRTPLTEIASATHIPIQELESTLKLVQQLDPAGVGARSLSECLLLQLDAIED